MHPGGFGWKSRKTGHVLAISKDDLRELEWIKIPHAYQLRLRAKGGFVYKFSGLKSQDKGVVKSYCSATFEIDLEDVHLSYKGWNWGEARRPSATCHHHRHRHRHRRHRHRRRRRRRRRHHHRRPCRRLRRRRRW